jgi:hypothetical protein
MKWFYLLVNLIAWQIATADEMETWYDAQGKPVGELPADAGPTTLPSDLVANDQPLIRAATEPWNAGRRFRRLRDWYLDAWTPFRSWYVGAGWFHRSPCVTPRFYGGNYRCGNSWNFSYRSPGFYLHWHR